MKSGGFAILACVVFGAPGPVDAASDTADSLSARIDRIETAHTREPWPVSQEMIDELRPMLENAGVDQRARLELMEARNLILAGQPEHALDVLESVLVQPVSLNNRARALELSTQAGLILQNHAQAFETLSAALDLMLQLDDPGYRANLLALAARVHDGAGEPAMALKYAAESLELARESGDGRVLCGAWWTLLRMQESAGLLDFALRGSDDLWEICQQTEDPVLIASSLGLIGRLHLRIGDHDAAMGWLRRSINMHDAAQYESEAQELRVDLGIALLDAGQIDAGLEMLTKSAESADMLTYRKKAEMHAAIADALAGREDYARALEHLELARRTGERDQESLRMQRLAYLQAEFENQRRNQQLQLLRQEHRVLALREDTSEAQRLARSIGTAVLLLIVLLLIGLLLRFRLDRRRFRKLSEIDGLTGLFNHRRFHHAVEDALAQSRERGKACVLVAADVDLFKQINDRYGHQAGDQVLRRLGALLLELFPAPSIVGRIGGEEFAIFLSDHNRLQAYRRINEFRDRIRPIEFDGCSIDVTLSFGLAESRRETRLERLRARADHALYRAKRAGRNQVIDVAEVLG